jgi:proteic killer suppression protein
VLAVIRSFKDRRTEALYRGETPAAFRAIKSVALRKLDMIDAATRLLDLRAPPGNRLEALKGSRTGQHSIRINDQWRICFVWRDGGAELVEIVDYH